MEAELYSPWLLVTFVLWLFTNFLKVLLAFHRLHIHVINTVDGMFHFIPSRKKVANDLGRTLEFRC